MLVSEFLKHYNAIMSLEYNAKASFKSLATQKQTQSQKKSPINQQGYTKGKP